MTAFVVRVVAEDIGAASWRTREERWILLANTMSYARTCRDDEPIKANAVIVTVHRGTIAVSETLDEIANMLDARVSSGET